MAKRFTESGKFRDVWYRELTPKQKCIWEFMISECDAGGVLEVDFKSMSFHIGAKISGADIDAFSERIIWISESKIFIPKFIKFQYPNGLSENNPAQKNIIPLLKKYLVYDEEKGAWKPLESPFLGAKEKEIEKETETEKTELNNKNKNLINTPLPPIVEKVLSFAGDADFVREEQAAYPDVDILGEIKRAADWCRRNPKRAPKSKPERFLRTWFSRSGEYFDVGSPKNDRQEFAKWFLENKCPSVLKTEDGKNAWYKQNRPSIVGIFAACETLGKAKELTAYAVEDVYEKNNLSWNLGTVSKNAISLLQELESLSRKGR